ncbi:MAG: flagellar biosynthetic protein FliO [Oscillibacter sp.]|nr:flagellar biosynthetic protein FliO [Oscillibacter sp.]
MLGDTTVASFLWLVVCVALILVLAFWFTRFAGSRGGFGGLQPPRQMELLDQLPLGRDQRLVLTRVGERFFLLGTGPGGINLLAEFTAEEAAAWKSEAGKPPGKYPSFQESLITILRQKGRR